MARRWLRLRDTLERWKFDTQHLTIDKAQRRLRLVLCRRGDVFFNGNVRQECFYFLGAQLLRMSLAMKMNEASNPIEIRLLGAQAVMPGADAIAGAVGEAWRWGNAGDLLERHLLSPHPIRLYELASA